MDWLAAHREHPLEVVFLVAVANLPVIALGFPVETVGLFVVLQKIHTVFVHANLRIRPRWLSALLAMPRFHHWHHAADGRPRNFATLFPWLDRLFGTYDEPDGHPAEVGASERVPTTWLGQLAHPFEPLVSPGHRPSAQDRWVTGS
jgi:sterol desaturase/sphingolipid hydroxylase (fatty acid hydroxylase superfamily)